MPVLDQHNEAEKERVRQYLLNSPYADMHQSFSWMAVKSDKWNCECVYLEEQGEIIAAALILVRTVAKVFHIMYAPRGPVCDIGNVELVNRLVREAEPLAKKYKSFVFKMDPIARYSDELAEAYRSSGFRVTADCDNILQLMNPRYSMILDIGGKTRDEVMAQYSSKTRYNIRLGMRKGISARWSREKKDIETFYRLLKITAERDGLITRDLEYYERVIECYGDQARIYLVEYEGEALSGALTIHYGNTVTYLYGASSNEHREMMPNYVMQQAMIDWAIENGCIYYSFGGVFSTDDSEGIYRFKKGFCKQEGAVQCIGELDRIYHPAMYYAFSKLLPKAEQMIIKFGRRALKKG